MDDIIRQLGYLCLGTRLRRLGERLQSDVQRLTESAGLTIQPGQYPLLAALDRSGPLTVNALVGAVGISQPGVTRALSRLVDMGLVEMNHAHRDQRHKTARLTALGQQAIERSKRDLWPSIEAAVEELCAGHSGPMLAQLDAMETALDAVPLHRRAGRHMHAAGDR